MQENSQDVLPHEIVDAFGRSFKTLRISVTNACNLGCVYCVDGVSKNSSPVNASWEDLLEIVSALDEILDLETIRLTGGEPTLYPHLVSLINGMADMGIPIKMTTNGFLLSRLAKPLKEAGLKELNISLDALDPIVFHKMARHTGIEKVKEGIDNALTHALHVKLNMVVVKGMNESQLLPLLEYAMERTIPIRFLELMRMGHLFSPHFKEQFFPQSEILEMIRRYFPIKEVGKKKSATATYWEMENGYQFGIIANESSPFCQDCDRLRLDSDGNLFGCLSENTPVPIRESIHDRTELVEKLKLALSHKQPGAFRGSGMTMIGIGG